MIILHRFIQTSLTKIRKKMKKLVLMAGVFALMFSCNSKKEEKVIENQANNTTEKKEVTLREAKPEEVAQLVKVKDNDTLYVTNFFATWCGPCMKEIPHFKEKMNELKGQPVKFTFVNLNDKKDWETDVKNFAKENGLESNILLLDGQSLDENFFKNNFKTWKGDGIPFTIISKKEKSEEILGGIDKKELEEKIKNVQ